MFSLLDVILVLIMLISGALALIRGFAREFLSIASWLVALYAVFLVYSNYPSWGLVLEPFVGYKIVSQVIIHVIIFAIVLIVVHLITIYFSEWVLNSSVGALDHTLGFIFGLARGLVVVALLHIFFAAVNPKVVNSWTESSRSLPLVEGTGEMIKSLLPADLIEMITEKTGQGESAQLPQDRIGPKLRKRAGSDVNRGYQNNDRRGLDQLVESAGATKN